MSSSSSIDVSGIAPETEILTNDGYFPISELEGRKISAWNGQEFVVTKVKKVGKSRPVLTIFTDDGQKIRCTPNRRILVDNGPTQEIGQISNFDDCPKVEAIDLLPHMKLAMFPFPTVEIHGNFVENAYLRGVASVHGRQYTSSVSCVDDDFSQQNQVVLEYVPKDRIVPTILPFRFYGDIFAVPSYNPTEIKLKWIAGFFDASLNPGIMGSKLEKFDAGIARHSNRDFLEQIQRMLQTLGVRSSVVLIDNEPGNFALMIHVHYIVKLFEMGMVCHCIKSPVAASRRPASLREPPVYVKSIINNFEVSDVYGFEDNTIPIATAGIITE